MTFDVVSLLNWKSVRKYAKNHWKSVNSYGFFYWKSVRQKQNILILRSLPVTIETVVTDDVQWWSLVFKFDSVRIFILKKFKSGQH